MKRKKLISGIMALALVSAIVPYNPIIANADTTYIINQVDHKCGDNATWSFDETTGTLTISGTGDMYDDMCNFFSETWFSKNVTNTTTTNEVSDFLVKNLVIEDGITSIGDWVFSSFNNLENVSLPDTLTTIGEYAFYCFKHGGVKLNSITIPKYVNSIGDKAFGYYSYTYSDENHDLQYGIEKIEDFTIKGYRGSQAETYANANGITFIALDDDKDITDNKCGDNATWSFDETTGTLTISGTGDTYDYTMNTAPFDYHGQIDIEANIKKIVVEDGITSLGDCIFFTDAGPLRNVESISLPESLVRIGNNSIAGFTESLKEINIPNNLKTIGDNAFLKWEDGAPYANPIKSMTIPKSVESIGKYAIGYVEGDGATFIAEEDFIIRGYKGSQAETYANANGITFVALDEEEPTNTTTPSDTTTTTTTTTTIVTEPNVTSKGYAKAYAEFLQSKEFEDYEDLKNQEGTPKYALAYLDGDDVPELIINYGLTVKNPKYYVFKYVVEDGEGSVRYLATINNLCYHEKKNQFIGGSVNSGLDFQEVYYIDEHDNVVQKYILLYDGNKDIYYIDKTQVSREEFMDKLVSEDNIISKYDWQSIGENAEQYIANYKPINQPNDVTTTPSDTTKPANDTTQPSNDTTTTTPKDGGSPNTSDGMGVLPLLTATGLIGAIAYILRKKDR